MHNCRSMFRVKLTISLPLLVCRRIEEMVTFCKKQHIRCNRDSSRSSLQPTVSLRDTPEKPCPSGTRRCPFQRECEAVSNPCIKDMDLFLQTHPRPTASSKMPLSFASRTPNMGNAQQQFVCF